MSRPMQVPVPKQIRTEGQRLLLTVPGTLLGIAHEIAPHVSAQNVLDWRNNGVRPRARQRALIFARYGIPVETWDQRPRLSEPIDPPANEFNRVQLAPAPPPPAEPLPEPVIESTTALEDCMRLLAIIRRDRALPGIIPTERAKLVDAEAKLLKLRAELEGRAELSEDRYVREHPAWLRARSVISNTLKQYPEAARAVAEALERLGL